MNDFIESIIQGHDKTDYRWVSGECSDNCFVCDSNKEVYKLVNFSNIQSWRITKIPQLQ